MPSAMAIGMALGVLAIVPAVVLVVVAAATRGGQTTYYGWTTDISTCAVDELDGHMAALSRRPALVIVVQEPAASHTARFRAWDVRENRHRTIQQLNAVAAPKTSGVAGSRAGHEATRPVWATEPGICRL